MFPQLNVLIRRESHSVSHEGIVQGGFAPQPEARKPTEPLLARQIELRLSSTTFTPSGSRITLTHGLPGQETTTLRTSTRSTISGGLAPSDAPQPTLLPPTTSRSGSPTSTAQTQVTLRTSTPSSPTRPPSASLSEATATNAPSAVAPAPTAPEPTTALSPVPGPGAPDGAANAVPDAAGARAVSSGMDAGSVVGFVLLALAGLAALIGVYFAIRKCVTKKPKPGLRLRDGPAGMPPFTSDSSDNDEVPMVMARAHPAIADQLGAIAYRVANGGQKSTSSRARATYSPAERVGPVARTFPSIAAQLRAIAERTQRGEATAVTAGPVGIAVSHSFPSVATGQARQNEAVVQQPLNKSPVAMAFAGISKYYKKPSVDAEEAEEYGTLPSRTYQPPSPAAPTRYVDATRTRYLVPEEESSEWVTVSPGIGPSRSFNTARMSGYYEPDSPVMRSDAVPRGW